MTTSEVKGSKNGWKKGEVKKQFYPIVNGKNPEWSYETVKEVLYNYMRTSGKYKYNLGLILEMLENEKRIDPDIYLPTKQVSTESEKAIADAENIVFDLRYKHALDSHFKNSNNLKNEMQTFCGDITSKCHEKMKEKIENEPDYITLKKQPIKLLLRVKKFMMSTDKTEHEYSNLYDTLERFFTCKMEENESVHAFNQRMKTAITGLKCVLGEKAFHDFATRTERYQSCSTKGEKDECQKGSFEAFTSIAILKNLDQKRYGNILQSFNQEYGLTHLPYGQRDKFPRLNEDSFKTAMKHTTIEVSTNPPNRVEVLHHAKRKLTRKLRSCRGQLQ
jgi:hypothetical protein